MYLLDETYEFMQKNSNFENFQSALYSTSVSMPLTVDPKWAQDDILMTPDPTSVGVTCVPLPKDHCT